MTDAADLLLELLELEPLEENLFRGQSPDTTVQRVFGGQVIGQALMAAQNTVGEERPCHSLHAYFLLPGDPTIPIVYHVERLRDGGSFTTRRVSAVQHGRPIFTIAASFQRRQAGYEHQFDMPEVKPPDACFSGDDRAVALEAAGMDMDQYRRVLSASPFEFRYSDIPDYRAEEALAPHSYLWLRPTRALQASQTVHQCTLAYCSDLTLLDTACRPHGVTWGIGKIQAASLDHAMWFHAPIALDDWILYYKDSPNASGGRGFARGSFHTRQGKTLASVAQEGLIRPVHPRP